MKATGIVRRIDELGRVVIPKEIRRTLRIKEGAPLEIFTEREGSIILKKYSPIGEMGEAAESLAAVVSRLLGRTCVICDRDSVVAAAGNGKKEYGGKTVSRDMQEAADGGKTMVTDKGFVPIYEGEDASGTAEQAIAPVLSDGYAIGAVVTYSKGTEKKLQSEDIRAIEVAAAFLGAQMEQA